jgi:O-antigen/teichoic acid export membrane protein
MGLVKNSSMVIAGIVMANILAYIFHIYVGRVLGPADYGTFGALIALYSLLALPSGAIGSAITKFTAQYNSKKDYNKIGNLRKKAGNKALWYSLVLFVLLLIFSPLIASYFNIPSVTGIIIVGFSVILTTSLSINRGILQGMKKFKDYSLNTIYESIIRLILVIILLYFGFKSNGAILAYGLAYLIAFALIFPKIKETKYQKDENLGLTKIYIYAYSLDSKFNSSRNNKPPNYFH